MSGGRALHACLSQWGGGHEPREDPSSNQGGVVRRGGPSLREKKVGGFGRTEGMNLVLSLESGSPSARARGLLERSKKRNASLNASGLGSSLVPAWSHLDAADLVLVCPSRQRLPRREGLFRFCWVCVCLWALSISSKLFRAFAVNYLPCFSRFNSALCVPLPAYYIYK